MARNTNPWIQFYTRDWLESERVMGMSCAAEGVYIRCLAAQHVRGNIPADVAKLARVLNKPVAEVESVWHEVVIHFESETIDGEERLFNEKLREQILDTCTKSKNYSKAQRRRHKVKSDSNLAQICDKSDTNPSQIPSVSVSSSVSVSDSKRILKEKFAEFYAAYPRKQKPGDAEKAWGKIKSVELADQIIAHIAKRRTEDDQWLRDGGKYIPYPATFLNAKGWEDEYLPSTPTSVYSNRQGYVEPVKPMPKQLPPFDAVPALLWEGVDYYFRQNDPEAAEEWIAPLKPLGVNGGELWVAAASNFGCEWVNRNYLDVITEQAAMPVKVISLEDYQGGAC